MVKTKQRLSMIRGFEWGDKSKTYSLRVILLPSNAQISGFMDFIIIFNRSCVPPRFLMSNGYETIRWIVTAPFDRVEMSLSAVPSISGKMIEWDILSAFSWVSPFLNRERIRCWSTLIIHTSKRARFRSADIDFCITDSGRPTP